MTRFGLLIGVALALALAAASPPHIVFILADDLGWNDVGWNGMSHIPTPNLDALALAGRALRRYYVLPVCTPSRAALLTGKHPIHTGMQRGVIYGKEPRGLPLSEKILPQYFKELGYKTHLVGKWHLGSYKKEYLPLNRGFDSHLGFWTGKIDMYDHTNMEQGSWGFDFRRGFETAHDLFGKYVTDVYTDEAVKLIKAHDPKSPLLLVVAHSAVHSGNPNQPIRAPDALVDSFRHLGATDPARQRFAGVLSKLDESVGRVTAALSEAGLLPDTVLVFSTDNGGAPAGFNDNAGSNYPLRGTKNTLWEGGVRGAGFVWSPRLATGAYSELMHISDWLPTLYSAAGGNVSALPLSEGDGVDQWAALVQSADESAQGTDEPAQGTDEPAQGAKEPPSAAPRRTVLHNIDDQKPTAAITVGDWKLLQGTTYKGAWDGWFGPAGRERNYSLALVCSSAAGRALAALGALPAEDKLLELRAALEVKCGEEEEAGVARACRPLEAPCLFNVAADPCERRNLAAQEPSRLEELATALAALNASARAPNNAAPEPRGDPARWGRVYTNFGDYDSTSPDPGPAALYL